MEIVPNREPYSPYKIHSQCDLSNCCCSEFGVSRVSDFSEVEDLDLYEKFPDV